MTRLLRLDPFGDDDEEMSPSGAPIPHPTQEADEAIWSVPALPSRRILRDWGITEVAFKQFLVLKAMFQGRTPWLTEPQWLWTLDQLSRGKDLNKWDSLVISVNKYDWEDILVLDTLLLYLIKHCKENQIVSSSIRRALFKVLATAVYNVDYGGLYRTWHSIKNRMLLRLSRIEYYYPSERRTKKPRLKSNSKVGRGGKTPDTRLLSRRHRKVKPLNDEETWREYPDLLLSQVGRLIDYYRSPPK